MEFSDHAESEPSHSTDELGKVLDEYRVSRFVVVVAWLATALLGLIWSLMMIIGVGVSLQGEADFLGIFLTGIPMTALFCGSLYITLRLQRSLVRCCEEGFLYREGRQQHLVWYGDISSAEVITERSPVGRNGGNQIRTIHYLRVRLNDDARTEIRIQPLLLQDVNRLHRWRSLMVRHP